MNMKALKLAITATAMALTAQVQAAVIATLTFDTPSGTVASNTPIDVFVTLTLDAASDAITTDASGMVTSGLTSAAIIAAGGDPNDIVRTLVNVGFQCGGTFTTTCTDGPPYDFTFDSAGFIGPVNLNLQPGSVSSFRFGTFSPTGGNAPAGTYSFYNAIVGFGFINAADQSFYAPFANTCSGQNPDCAFTRSVFDASAVPEPASWAMMLAGFGLVGFAMRGRAKTTRVSFV